MQVYHNYGTPESWKSLVPATGVLCFDYVSGTSPPLDALPISERQLLEFLQGTIGIAVDPETGLLVPEPDHDKADLQVVHGP